MLDALCAALLGGIAGFALTYIIKFTSGPADIFMRWRRYIGIEGVELVTTSIDPLEQELQVVDLEPGSFTGKLFSCYWCLTTWICLLLVVGYILVDNSLLLYGLHIWFAAVGVSGYLLELV